MADDYKIKLLRSVLAIATDNWNDPAGARDFEQTELSRTIGDNQLSDQELVLGLLSLTNVLLVKMESAGMDVDEVLRDIGLRYG